KKDKAALAYLSPAEKYDLLIGAERSIPPVLLTRLQVQEDRYRKEVAPKSEKFAEEFKVQSERLRQIYEKYREANRQRRELTVEMEKAMQAGNTSLVKELDGKLSELSPPLSKYDDERQKLIEQ